LRGVVLALVLLVAFCLLAARSCAHSSSMF
jgi:hypothetical protein